MLVSFFGRLAYKFANTFARSFGLALRFDARAIRRRFGRVFRRASAITLQPGSVLAPVRYYFVFLTVFRFCLLDNHLLMFDVQSWLG